MVGDFYRHYPENTVTIKKAQGVPNTIKPYSDWF